MSYCISIMKNGKRIFVSRQITFGPNSKELTDTQNDALLFQKEKEARKFMEKNFLDELGFQVWFCAARVVIEKPEKKEVTKEPIVKIWNDFTPSFLKV